MKKFEEYTVFQYVLESFFKKKKFYPVVFG